MRAVVTGASGFVGGHVVEALCAAGHEVVAFVRPTSDRGVVEAAGAEVAFGDITDAGALASAMKGADTVIHTAAVVSTYGSWEEYRRVGVVGTERVVEAATRAAVRRLVHLSSIAVYGFRGEPGVVLREDLPFDDEPEPWNHYVREKVLSERIAWRAHEARELEVTALRPSVIIGVRDRNVVTRAMNVLRLPINGTIGPGTNRVACVVVGDLVQAILAAATSPGASGRAYNVSGRDPITQRELFSLYAQAAGRSLQPFFTPYRLAMAGTGFLERLYGLAGQAEEPIFARIAVPIFGQDFLVESERARAELGFRGDSSYEAAIRESVGYHLARERSGAA